MRHAFFAAAVVAFAIDPLAAQTPEWSVSPQPAVQIGAIDADSSYLLHRVSGVTRLHDGRIVILDASGLRYYSAEGQYIGTAARQGRGPGEYQVGQLLRTVADTLIIWDGASRNRLIIGPKGEYVRNEPLTVELPAYPAVSFEFSKLVSRSALLSWPQGRHVEGSVGELERSTTAFKLVDLDSGGITELGVYPQKIARVLANGLARHAYQPYSPETVHGVGPDHIYVGDSAGRAIQVFTLTGEPRSSIAADFKPVGVTSRDLDAARARALSNRAPELRPLAERLWAEAPKPETFPYFDRLMGASDGQVWIRHYRVDPDAATQWQILDSTGVAIGVVQLPGRFELHAVEDQYLIGVWRDELDVEYVQVWRVSR